MSGNRAKWLDTMLGAFKARLVPINVNHRYAAAELAQVLADAECTAVVAEHALLEPLATVANRLPRLCDVVALDDGHPEPAPVGRLEVVASIAYEEALAAASPAREFGARSGDDRYIPRHAPLRRAEGRAHHRRRRRRRPHDGGQCTGRLRRPAQLPQKRSPARLPALTMCASRP